MEIEFVTSKKKLTKSMVKQMELATWETINNQLKENPNTEFFKINDVFKFSVVIFNGFDGDWYYLPFYDYTLSEDHKNVLINKGKYLFIKNVNSAELFIENIDLIKNRVTKIFI